MIAAAYIHGLQEKGIGACIKHYVGNDMEHQRSSGGYASLLALIPAKYVPNITGGDRAVDVRIPERALREI